MLLDEQIISNKNRFLELVNSITPRSGMDRELLIRQLVESDFFVAPASANYHGNYPGGLCEHSLQVYDNLIKLVNEFVPNKEQLMDSVKIIALFHDFSKMNFYTNEVKNRKVYSENGKKSDSMGKYDWESYQSYGYRDAKDRFLIGNHEENSAYMINTFIPLNPEEFCAISHHHGSTGFDSTKQNPAEFWSKYPLSLLLYQADCISSFIQ